MNDELNVAAQILRDGGVVAHACEGVWGLACDPWKIDSVRRILRIKQRPEDKGLIVIGASEAEFARELEGVPSNVRRTIVESWPGRTTWIVPNERFPSCVTGDRPTIAVRVPGHEQARQLCQRFGGPLISTSANISEEEPARTVVEVQQIFGELLDMVLPGSIGDAEGPSEIRSAMNGARLR